MVILPAKEHREHAQDPAVVVGVEVDHRAALGDIAHGLAQMRPQRALMRRAAQRVDSAMVMTVPPSLIQPRS